MYPFKLTLFVFICLSSFFVAVSSSSSCNITFNYVDQFLASHIPANQTTDSILKAMTNNIIEKRTKVKVIHRFVIRYITSMESELNSCNLKVDQLPTYTDLIKELNGWIEKLMVHYPTKASKLSSYIHKVSKRFYCSYLGNLLYTSYPEQRDKGCFVDNKLVYRYMEVLF